MKKSNVKLGNEYVGAIINRPKGITLIALVITIVVLIILAGVAINLSVGENGIFRRAQEAKLQYEIAQAKEELDIKIAKLQLEKQGSATLQDVVDMLKAEDMNYIVSLEEIASITGVDVVGDVSEIYVVYKIYQFRIYDTLETEFISIVDSEYDKEEIQYTVTFNANGGICDVENKKITQNTNYGSLPEPTKEGYRFLGWYTDLENENQIQETDIVTANITLYAKWEEAADLIAWYDGINNTNDGHSYEVNTWTDLTGNNETGATLNGATWTEDGLLFDGDD